MAYIGRSKQWTTRLHLILQLAVCFVLTTSVTVTDIQGDSFISPLVGQSVSNVTGIVTAKVFFLSSLLVSTLTVLLRALMGFGSRALKSVMIVSRTA